MISWPKLALAFYNWPQVTSIGDPCMLEYMWLWLRLINHNVSCLLEIATGDTLIGDPMHGVIFVIN